MAHDEWTMSYNGQTLTMGLGTSDVFFEKPVDFGEPAFQLEDTFRPRQDGTSFGSDFRSGRTITFEVGVVASSEAAALAAGQKLAKLWRADWLRETPGRLATMDIGSSIGRPRTLYGRPRRYAPVGAKYKGQGYLSYLLDFECVDDVFYGQLNTMDSNMLPVSSGGFKTPVKQPVLAAAPSDSRPNSIFVDGDLKCWPTFRIKGPIVNPVITVTGIYSLTLNHSIPAGKYVYLDTRPWNQTVYQLDTGANLSNKLARTSRLDRAWLYPGSYEVLMRGTDPTKTAALQVQWRASYASL